MITKLIDKNKALEKLAYKEPFFGGDSTRERYRYMQWLADVNAIEELKSVRAIVIPEGATNGDIIKAIFSNCELKEHIDNSYFEMYFDNDLRNASYMRVSKDWWNAPFKRVEE